MNKFWFRSVKLKGYNYLKKLFKSRTVSVNQGHMLKLNLGCGYDYLQGCVNIDMTKDSLADLIIDFKDLKSKFEANSVDEILMFHSISYLNLWEARELLEDIYKLLKKDGKIILEFPDVTKCAKTILKSRENYPDYIEGVRAIYAFDLTYLTKRIIYQPYAFGWSDWHLEMELKKIGYKNVISKDPQTHGQLIHRDVRIEACK
jgi:hypothetical protein